MNALAYIALILLITGLVLIVSGLIGIYRNRKTNKSVELSDHYPAQEQPKAISKNNSVLQKMQHDEALKQKILEEIEKQSK